MTKTGKTRILVEGAMMIALTTILSMIKLYELPMGGSVTLQMLPIVVMGYRRGVKWGCFTGLVHGLIQTLLGLSNVLYCTTLLAQIGCVLLDYVLAYSCLGLSGLFKGMSNRFLGLMLGGGAACVLRFVCSFLSGVLIWGGYAPEGQTAAVYSLVYNGSYWLPSAVLVMAALAGLYKLAPKTFEKL